MPAPDPRFLDAGHEAIWQAVLAAISDLGTTTNDTYYLTDLLFSLLDGALTSLSQTRADLAALTVRVAALEPAPPPVP